MKHALIVVLSATACGPGGGGAGTPTASGAAFPYDLVCDSADTAESSTLFCMRIDTRDGDIRHVELSKLPQSNGPTRSAEGPPGTYKLVCDSTDTSTKSDFRCLRLNRQTGEVLLIALPKVGKFPE